MTRKLASVQRIVNIEPIPDADAIEKATVLGWEVVIAKKDNLHIGDLVVYFEVDSLLPDKPEFEFMRDRKFRVKTIRLRKQISQGLVFSLSILPNKKWNEGDDVTEIIGVKKYDPEGDLERRLFEEKQQREKNKLKKFLMKYTWYRTLFNFFNPKKDKGWPKFIKKTDEDRIQLFPHICENEKDTTFTVTEKIDGQSGTYFLVKKKNLFGKKYIFGVCSRNVYLKTPDNSSYWTIARKYNIENVLKNLVGNNDYIVLQGEIVGTNIQGNKYGVKEHDFYAFNLIASEVKVGTTAKRYLLDQHGIKCVPLLDTNFRLKPTIAEMVDFSNGKSVLADTLREGIVVRNYEKNISFKVVSPEFLLKHGE